MAAITWNTEVNAPCCPGEIVHADGRTLLIQTDWDYPGTAQTFGWWLGRVQKCPGCGTISHDLSSEYPLPKIATCPACEGEVTRCEHEATDGTVTCKACGLGAGDFISAAYDWLRDHDGATADDPGYFDAGGE